MDDKLLNLIQCLISGSATGQINSNIWTYEPGVRFFTDIFAEELAEKIRRTVYQEVNIKKRIKYKWMHL